MKFFDKIKYLTGYYENQTYCLAAYKSIENRFGVVRLLARLYI